MLWPVAGRFMLSPDRGARTSVWAATSPELEGVTGAYLAAEAISAPGARATDDVAAARLWTVSEELVGIR